MSAKPQLYTVGHGTRPIQAFLDLLHSAGVRRLVDVRRFPGSKRNPQFAGESLAASLQAAGIEYVWMGRELGGFRKARPDSRHTALTTFRGYADHMDTEEFRVTLDRLIETSRDVPTAIMCAESVWWRCHRQLIADALVAAGADVLHLLDADPRPHTLHRAARIEEGRPVYDVGVQSSLDV